MITVIYELSEYDENCYDSIKESFENYEDNENYPFNVIVFDYENLDDFIYKMIYSKIRSHLNYYNEKNKTNINLEKLLVDKVGSNKTKDENDTGFNFHESQEFDRFIRIKKV